MLFACPCSSLSLLALSLFCCTRAGQPHVDGAEARVKSARAQEDSLSYGTTMTICHHETGSDIGELRLPVVGCSCLFTLLSAIEVSVILGA